MVIEKDKALYFKLILALVYSGSRTGCFENNFKEIFEPLFKVVIKLTLTDKGEPLHNHFQRFVAINKQLAIGKEYDSPIFKYLKTHKSTINNLKFYNNQLCDQLMYTQNSYEIVGIDFFKELGLNESNISIIKKKNKEKVDMINSRYKGQ